VLERLKAVRSIRLNYTRRGTLRWLAARHRRHGCRGWRRVWRDPAEVCREQHALAEGAFA
jgi:hypothetical protein